MDSKICWFEVIHSNHFVVKGLPLNMYNKNVPDVSVTITEILQGEVKEKPHKNTDINKTLIKNSRYVSSFLVCERQVQILLGE